MIVAQLVVADCIETPRVGVKLKQGGGGDIYIYRPSRTNETLSLSVSLSLDSVGEGRGEKRQWRGVCVVRRRETVCGWEGGGRNPPSASASASASSFSSHS